MWKAAVAAAGVFALAGTTILVAQDRGGEGYRRMGPGMMQGDRDGPRGGGHPWNRLGGALVMGREHPKLSADDMRAFADARIAALHAGLELRPDQEKNWPPFEQALRAAAKDRIDRLEGRILKRAQDTRDFIKTQYEHGAASLVDLLFAERTLSRLFRARSRACLSSAACPGRKSKRCRSAWTSNFFVPVGVRTLTQTSTSFVRGDSITFTMWRFYSARCPK